jgi:hypothetical protein
MHVVGAPEPAPGLSGVSNMAAASPLPAPLLPPQLAIRIVSAATAPRKLVGMFTPSYQWRDSPSTCVPDRHVHRCASTSRPGVHEVDDAVERDDPVTFAVQRAERRS